MVFIQPKYSEEIQKKFVSWLNDNLDDPYEQTTQKKRNTFVYGADFELTAINLLPKINVAIDDVDNTKIATQTKTTYLEEEEHQFMIYYYNQKVHRYTFGNGNTLIGEAQCRRYLQQIKTQIKANATDFNDYGHKITFGKIAKPIFLQNNNVWVSMLPMTITTYRK